MRHLFLLLFLTFIAGPLDAALAAPVVPTNSIALTDFSREAVEAQLGRKLKFTERIALSIVRKKAKKQARKKTKRGSGDGTVTDVPSLVAMVCGILGFLGIWVTLFAGLLGVAALILGIIGLGRFKKEPGYRKGKGFAIAGIVLGGTLIALLLLVAAVLLIVFR